MINFHFLVSYSVRVLHHIISLLMSCHVFYFHAITDLNLILCGIFSFECLRVKLRAFFLLQIFNCFTISLVFFNKIIQNYSISLLSNKCLKKYVYTRCAAFCCKELFNRLGPRFNQPTDSDNI